MAFIRWIVGFLLTVIIAAFAIMNRADVLFVWSPLHDAATIPAYLLALGAMAAGFILGGVTVWLNTGVLRREKRRQKKDLKAMEQKIEKLKEAKFDHAPPAPDLFPALPYKAK